MTNRKLLTQENNQRALEEGSDDENPLTTHFDSDDEYFIVDDISEDKDNLTETPSEVDVEQVCRDSKEL